MYFNILNACRQVQIRYADKNTDRPFPASLCRPEQENAAISCFLKLPVTKSDEDSILKYKEVLSGG